MSSELTEAAAAVEQATQPVGEVAPVALLILVVVPLFLMSPFSNILNVITVPLGYEWQSCPYCPEFGIEKITKADCDHCGDEHVENWGAGARRDGDWYSFCDSDCLDGWKATEKSQQ